MKKTLLVMAMAIALVLSMMAGAVASDHEATIDSPAAAEVVYENMLHLEADAGTSETTEIAFAVRFGADENCQGGTNKAFASGIDTEADGTFARDLAISTWEPGEYCFVFNTEPGPDVNLDPAVRPVQHFYVVDDYVVVDASIDEPLDTYEPDTAKPDYSVSGVVGLYGTDGLAGVLEVRYHSEKVTCYVDLTTGTAFTRFYAGPTDTDADDDLVWMDDLDYSCNNGGSGTFDDILLLEPGHQGPGGAIAVDENGDRALDPPYDLIGTWELSRNWVPLDRGEADFHIW